MTLGQQIYAEQVGAIDHSVSMRPQIDTCEHQRCIDAARTCRCRRQANGEQVWAIIGGCDAISLATARERAREAMQRIKEGRPPFAAAMRLDSFEDIAKQWLKRHVAAKALRSADAITRLFKAHVYPAWKDRAFLDIRRSDVASLLDEIEDDHGARQTDYVLAIVR
jgi:hypothetical protein